ncbi:hypothetical protein APHAL10511_005799 [Amanita phalloides]|nr:hypothetical protein APHAL10511_005799 [Amanita phalloides]
MSHLQTVHAPKQPDINQDFEDPSHSLINDPNHFYAQDPDIDEAMCKIQQDLIWQELPYSPTSPPPNDNPGEVPCLPQPEFEPMDEEGNSSNDKNREMVPEDEEGGDNEGEDLPSVSTNDPWPQPALPKLTLAKDMIENIRAAHLEDDLNEEMLANLRSPPKEPEVPDKLTLFAMSIFNQLISCSERVYEGVRATIQQFTGCKLHMHHVVKSKIECTTRVTQLQTDMCINSCVAFTGPFKELDKHPKCNEHRYKENNRTKKMQPRKQFYTIPVGPQIQAMWRTPEGADHMRYCDWKMAEIIETILATGKILKFDVLHGLEYLKACCAGKITPDDTLLMFSLDGAQLYHDKESDCWFAIWVVLNLSPDLCYQKVYILLHFLSLAPTSQTTCNLFFYRLSGISRHYKRKDWQFTMAVNSI